MSQLCLYPAPSGHQPSADKNTKRAWAGGQLCLAGGTQGVGSAGKQSKGRANRRKRQETLVDVFRNLPGETAAMDEIHLALKDCSCPGAWSWYQVVAAGIAVVAPV